MLLQKSILTEVWRPRKLGWNFICSPIKVFRPLLVSEKFFIILTINFQQRLDMWEVWGSAFHQILLNSDKKPGKKLVWKKIDICKKTKIKQKIWLHLLIYTFAQVFNCVQILNPMNEKIRRGRFSKFDNLKVQIFSEGQQKFPIFHSLFGIISKRQVTSGKWDKFFWPSENIRTLTASSCWLSSLDKLTFLICFEVSFSYLIGKIRGMMTFLISVSCEVFGRHMGWTSVDGRSTFTQDFSLSSFIYEKDKKEKKG